MTAPESNIERLRKLYQAFEIGGPETAGKLISEVFDLSLVYEFAGGLVRRVTAYESPAEALEAAERGHANA
jgi:hypothetical protein